MKVTRIVSNILDSNVFVVEKNGHCLIVDCGAEVEKVASIVGNLSVDGILLTHGHFDHAVYCNEYAKLFGAKIYADVKAVEAMSDSIANYSNGEFALNDFSNIITIYGDKKIKLGEFEIDCISASGHSACSQCYLIAGNLFAGDVLFENGIGRTDLIGSDRKEMIKTLNKLEEIEFDKVFSGHGEESDRTDQLKNISIFKRFLQR